MMDTLLVDYYALLSVPSTASPSQLKTAYHRTLLAAHPDKNPARDRLSGNLPDIALIKLAYRTLSEPQLRSEYDVKLRGQNGAHNNNRGPRPAQVISLEEFDEDENDERWTYACRCGGVYKITGDDMEEGHHLIGCNSCSETVWVGFEVAETAEAVKS